MQLWGNVRLICSRSGCAAIWYLKNVCPTGFIHLCSIFSSPLTIKDYFKVTKYQYTEGCTSFSLGSSHINYFARSLLVEPKKKKKKKSPCRWEWWTVDGAHVPHIILHSSVIFFLYFYTAATITEGNKSPTCKSSYLHYYTDS